MIIFNLSLIANIQSPIPKNYLPCKITKIFLHDQISTHFYPKFYAKIIITLLPIPLFFLCFSLW